MQNLALALVENFLLPKRLGEICSNPRKDYQMAYKLQKNNRIANQKQRDGALKPGKTTGYGVFCAHARNQICQVTSEEKFSFHAADEVIHVWTGN